MSTNFGAKSYEAFQTALSIFLSELSEMLDMVSLVRKVLVCKEHLPNFQSESGILQDEGRVKTPISGVLRALAEEFCCSYDPVKERLRSLADTFAFAESQMFSSLLAKDIKPGRTLLFETLDEGCFRAMRTLCLGAGIVPVLLIVNRQELSDIAKHFSQIHFVTDREQVLHGFVGSFENVSIVTDSGYLAGSALNPGEWYMFGSPEQNGEVLSSPARYEEVGQLVFEYGCSIKRGSFIRGHKPGV